MLYNDLMELLVYILSCMSDEFIWYWDIQVTYIDNN